ncbi:hypothetical protein PAXRUDRAFT_409403 [Paxillus rubicundulus Ve08.2h10]|uniref:Uncharacterized protein n=1 Tax=Paxillus rubicundulus Ve08.2h10 TaxID=930991 RepID=A0A0D0DY23_9AGAM|nr:hypothetical protein PAXRUDRAFT_409403 [Paxillus rubicundulus Ve08.2h10]
MDAAISKERRKTLERTKPICKLAMTSTQTTVPLRLPTTIKPGVVNIPGRDPEAQEVAESLLEQDRQKDDCFWNPKALHNHLSHQDLTFIPLSLIRASILVAYDLGAPTSVLQAIYDTQSAGQRPIDVEEDVTPDPVKITPDNFREHLGQERYYLALLTFFTEQIKELGVSQTLEKYIFSATVNVNGSDMLSRFMNGV